MTTEKEKKPLPNILSAFYASMVNRIRHKEVVSEEVRTKRYLKAKKLRKIQKMSRRANRGNKGRTQLHRLR